MGAAELTVPRDALHVKHVSIRSDHGVLLQRVPRVADHVGGGPHFHLLPLRKAASAAQRIARTVAPAGHRPVQRLFESTQRILRESLSFCELLRAADPRAHRDSFLFPQRGRLGSRPDEQNLAQDCTHSIKDRRHDELQP